jgi:RimJ/RimL family protein N-acetyltransferase
MPVSIAIQAASSDASALLDAFFACLKAHVAENGAADTGYFLPMPRHESVFSAEREQRFRSALAISPSDSGWRRLWLARSPSGEVMGHVDLRGHSDAYATHRCLLGLGVRSGCRRAGVAAASLARAENWARAEGLQWIDLQVLSVNERALRAYRRAGFITVGEVPEMFQLDGQL